MHHAETGAIGRDMSFLYLSIAIIAEVIATSALKASNGFSVLWPSTCHYCRLCRCPVFPVTRP